MITQDPDAMHVWAGIIAELLRVEHGPTKVSLPIENRYCFGIKCSCRSFTKHNGFKVH